MIAETHERVVINVSREDFEPDLVELAKAVNEAISKHELGATFSRTLGIWQGKVEQGIEIKLTYPLIDVWAQRGADAEKDILFTLRLLLPTQRYFQVEREHVFLGEWDTRIRRFSEQG